MAALLFWLLLGAVIATKNSGHRPKTGRKKSAKHVSWKISIIPMTFLLLETSIYHHKEPYGKPNRWKPVRNSKKRSCISKHITETFHLQKKTSDVFVFFQNNYVNKMVILTSQPFFLKKPNRSPWSSGTKGPSRALLPAGRWSPGRGWRPGVSDRCPLNGAPTGRKAPDVPGGGC